MIIFAIWSVNKQLLSNWGKKEKKKREKRKREREKEKKEKLRKPRKGKTTL